MTFRPSVLIVLCTLQGIANAAASGVLFGRIAVPRCARVTHSITHADTLLTLLPPSVLKAALKVSAAVAHPASAKPEFVTSLAQCEIFDMMASNPMADDKSEAMPTSSDTSA